jgi:hypothetical protein
VGGCTNCGSKAGCDHRKGDMMASVEDVLARAYPSRTWGEVDDAAAVAALVGGGVGADEGAALAEELAAELTAATFYVPGAPEDLCDYVYVLALGRPPCLLQVRDLGASPADLEPGPIRELYLRVCLSSLARLAAVQQIAMEADPVPGDVGWIVRETRRAGVYDAPLLRRLQRLVALLPAYDLVSVDFGDISAPPPGFHPGSWPALYGGAAPAVANYLFFPEPATLVTTSFLPGATSMEAPCSTTR